MRLACGSQHGTSRLVSGSFTWHFTGYGSGGGTGRNGRDIPASRAVSTGGRQPDRSSGRHALLALRRSTPGALGVRLNVWQVLEAMSRGDHIRVRRWGYSHHGVGVDDGMVVHFTGTPGSMRGAAIRREPIETFAAGGRVEVIEYAERFEADEAVCRAESRLGESGYNLYGNNCEHFARWCLTDDHSSSQVNAVNATGAVGASTATAAAGVGVVSTVGTVAGLSGSGIMSGLATTGAVVGSGAMGGLAVLSAAPGIMSVAVMQVALRDDPALPVIERSSRNVGRKASVVGAAGGSAAGLAAVSAAGTVAGVSAAGITSGLAAIGGIVCGGMAAGTAVVIAGPAIAAAGVGYGAYRATRAVRKHLSETEDGTVNRALSAGTDAARRAGADVTSRAQEFASRRFSRADQAEASPGEGVDV